MLFKIIRKPLPHYAVGKGSEFAVAQLCFGLPLKLRLLQLDRYNTGKPLAHIVSRQRGLAVLKQLELARIFVYHPRQRPAEVWRSSPSMLSLPA